MLFQCGGTQGGPWFDRFGELAKAGGEVRLSVTLVASACHFWAKLQAEVCRRHSRCRLTMFYIYTSSVLFLTEH